MVIKNIDDFQADCLLLSEKNYPTIHNQGMTEHHLALTFTRRMCDSLKSQGYNPKYNSVSTIKSPNQPHHYKISSEEGSIWVFSNHMLNGGTVCRNTLLNEIEKWRVEYDYAISENDLLVLISDHLFTRSQQSRELLYWWMGALPENISDYKQQGITLHPSDATFVQSLESTFSIIPQVLRYEHPLQRLSDKKPSRKYIQFFAILQWQK